MRRNHVIATTTRVCTYREGGTGGEWDTGGREGEWRGGGVVWLTGVGDGLFVIFVIVFFFLFSVSNDQGGPLLAVVTGLVIDEVSAAFQAGATTLRAHHYHTQHTHPLTVGQERYHSRCRE